MPAALSFILRIFFLLIAGCTLAAESHGSWDRQLLDSRSRQIIEAARYGNSTRMDELLRTARESGEIPDWLMEYGCDLLDSCAGNGILFTAGTLDTAVTWYLQRISGYRKDVTVVPFGLLNKPWYLLALAEKPQIAGRCVPFGLSGMDILSKPPPGSDGRNQSPSSLPESSGDPAGASCPVFADSIFRKTNGFGTVNRHWFAHIIRSNSFKRPVHFSIVCAKKLFCTIGSGFCLSGLTYRMHPGRSAAIDLKKTRSIIMGENSKNRNGDEAGLFPPAHADSILMQYAYVCRELAAHSLSLGRSREAELYSRFFKQYADSCGIFTAESLRTPAR